MTFGVETQFSTNGADYFTTQCCLLSLLSGNENDNEVCEVLFRLTWIRR